MKRLFVYFHVLFFFFILSSSAIADFQGTIGTRFTINGSGFGNSKSKIYLLNAGKQVQAKVETWADSSITCLWTKKISPGTYPLFVQPKGKGISPISAGNFVIKQPTINEVKPNNGSAGDVITINGSYFSNKKPKVYLEDPNTHKKKSCKVTSFSMDAETGNSSLQFIVPKWGLTDYNLILINTIGQVTVKFPFQDNITSQTGSININEIGGEDLNIVSPYQTSNSEIIDSSFTTNVSSSGTQLLTLVDINNEVRGLTLSQINSSDNTTNILPLDATSTALSLLFLTPGISTTDPVETEIKIAQLKQLNTFDLLVNYLRINLPTKSLNKIIEDIEFNDLLTNCIKEWMQTYSVVSSTIKMSSIKDSFSFQGRHGGVEVSLANNVTDMNFIKFKLSNYGWRFVNIHRQLLDSTNNVIEAKAIHSDETPMPGAVPLSWGSIFTGTVSKPTSEEDWNSISFNTSGTKTVEYWIVGPGLATSSYSLPSAINADYSNALETSIIYYFTYPMVDLFLGLKSTVNAGTDSVVIFWKMTKTLVPITKLKTLMEEKDTDWRSIVRETTNVGVQFITVGARLGAFSAAGILTVAQEKALSAITSGFNLVLSGANALIFTGYLFEVPHITKIKVDYIEEPPAHYYSITGRVTYNGLGLKDVAMSFKGPSVVVTILTDSNGNYTLSGLQNGTYTITPSKEGYSFSPTSLQVTVSGDNVTVQDFTATQTPPPCISPGTPTLNDPGTSVTLGTTYTVSWSSVSGADSYELCEDGGLSCWTITAPTTSKSFTKVGTVSHTYTYTVRAHNSCGYGPVSNTVDITVNPVNNSSDSFYDDFSDGIYTDKWSVVTATGTNSITETNGELYIHINKPQSECSSVVLDTTSTVSGQNLTIETRMKPGNKGGMYVLLKANDNNYVGFGVNSNDAQWLETVSSQNGTVNANHIENSTPYYGVYNTYKIVKTGNQFDFYVNDIKKGGSITLSNIGDTNLKIELANHTCSWKTGDSDNYFDYVKVSSQSAPTTVDVSGTWFVSYTPTSSTCSWNPVGVTQSGEMVFTQSGQNFSVTVVDGSWGRPQKGNLPLIGTISGNTLIGTFYEAPDSNDTECPTCTWTTYFNSMVNTSGNTMTGTFQQVGSGGACSMNANMTGTKK